MKTLLPPDSVSRGLTRVCDWTVIACGWGLLSGRVALDLAHFITG